MIRLTLILLALPLAGCGLDVLEGKPSPFKAELERREALTLAVAEVVEPAVVVAEVEPCVDVWRITTCTDGVAGEWQW